MDVDRRKQRGCGVSNGSLSPSLGSKSLQDLLGPLGGAAVHAPEKSKLYTDTRRVVARIFTAASPYSAAIQSDSGSSQTDHGTGIRLGAVTSARGGCTQAAEFLKYWFAR